MDQVKNIFWKSMLSAVLVCALCAGLLAGCGSDAASGSVPDSVPDSTSAPDSAASGDTEDDEPIDFSAGLDENGFLVGVKALDYVTLPADYAAIPVPADAVEVTEEDIQTEIDGICEQYAEPERITDRAVEDGEYVNIDYSGSMDGEIFPGGTAADQRVLSGSEQFIDDFLTQIIGHMPGETFNVEVTFPDPYQNNPDYAGKDAVFEVTINYIEGEMIVQEFTDEFVSENLSSWGWETVEDGRQEIHDVLYEMNLSDYVWQYMLDNAQIDEIPQAALDFQTATMLNNLRSEAQSYGIPLEYYLQAMGGVESVDAFVEMQEEYILSSARQQMILQAICEDSGRVIGDEDIKAYFLENMGTEDYSIYEETFGRPYLCMAVTVDQLNTMMTENAVIG